jgi:hypothetical protein
MERRAQPRKKMVLPVKVAVDKGTGLAYTMDITSGGARLGGLRTGFEAGQIVSLVRNGRKANFRVVWILQVNPNEMHAGIEALQPVENFWGVDFKGREARNNEVDALLTLLGKKP